MSEKYKFHDPEGIYFVTPTIVGWADLFTKQQYWHIVLDALAHYQQNNGLIIHAWCVMSSHLHLIISTSKTFTRARMFRVRRKSNNIVPSNLEVTSLK